MTFTTSSDLTPISVPDALGINIPKRQSNIVLDEASIVCNSPVLYLIEAEGLLVIDN